jgi:hypothetical protein
METKELLTYCWKHKLFGKGLKTSNGKNLQIIDVGLFDRHHGSRFFNAKLGIDSTLWVGYVLVFEKSSDFYQSDIKDSSNVILVVCSSEDQPCFAADGTEIPRLVVSVPDSVTRNYDALMGADGDTLCHRHIMQYTTPLSRHAWIAAMQTEFLENETEYISRFYKESGDLEKTFFIALLRAFGFATNKTTMDLLARNICMNALENCRDNLFQIEAIILGQAGLLTLEPDAQRAIPEKYLKHAQMEGYFAKLRNEWLYLKNKFNMPLEISRLCWQPYGGGGLTYPNVYLSMLANWWYCRKMDSKTALNIKTAKEAMNLFNTHCTPYWETHYVFGSETSKCMKCLSNDRKAWLVAACLTPFLFFYGRHTSNEELCDRAFEIMEQLGHFSTSDTNYFKKFGFEPTDAGEVVGMTHLKAKYCNPQCKAGAPRLCLLCRFGREFITKH